MKFTCPECGWIKETESYQMTTGDLQEVFEHERSHK